jgi:hypothetical protein
MKMSETKKSYWQILQEIPVSINVTYGDAFIPSQWDNTLEKLSTLASCGHKGAVMIGSKYPITDAQLEKIKKINEDVWIFIAITGIDDCCVFSTKEYEEYYLRVSKHLKNVVCAIRPIIPHRNDNMETLLPLIQMVGKGRKMLTYGGYKDTQVIGNPQYRNELLFNSIEQECEKYSIICREKSVCLVCAVTDIDCFVHSKAAPINLDLIEALGYKFHMENGQLIVTGYKGSTHLSKGDISFIRMLSRSSLVSGNISSPFQILSLRINDKPLVSTSSWFNWTRQTHCEVGCDFCSANYDSKLRLNLEEFGCNPTDLIEIL